MRDESTRGVCQRRPRHGNRRSGNLFVCNLTQDHRPQRICDRRAIKFDTDDPLVRLQLLKCVLYINVMRVVPILHLKVPGHLANAMRIRLGIARQLHQCSWGEVPDTESEIDE